MLSGPHPLTVASVTSQVTRVSPGSYVLSNDGTARYAGRSDIDLRSRLLDHVGKYARFWFEYAPSAKAAFEQECYLYHNLHPTDNAVHPAAPAGSYWHCAVCGR